MILGDNVFGGGLPKLLRNSVEEVKNDQKLLFSDVMSMTHKNMALLNLMGMETLFLLKKNQLGYKK